MHQRGVKRQLRVFRPVFDALGGAAAGLGFVINQQGVTVGLAINPVDLSEQCQLAQGHFAPRFGGVKHRAAGFVPGEPGQIALAHARPDGGEGQKLSFAQAQLLRASLSRYVNHSYSHPFFLGWGIF